MASGSASASPRPWRSSAPRWRRKHASSTWTRPPPGRCWATTGAGVAVWVTLPSLDDIVERNKASLEAETSDGADLERRLAPLRSQATQDAEWALTSGAFDFTVLNVRREEALQELLRAAAYCFEDPF
ncbi:unnamed protein product [Prorocentrum cordatum]|uniref:Uncharacterized protein n=1 Tax=Prorocentrum cordatum TaxID=2364126 RepID=A0ABN9SVL9_9DINO|nr:unnamed protein product [Polarella glacialis]